MRWGRAVVVAVVVVALAACGGGGKKSDATASGSPSNGSQLSAGSETAPQSGSTGDGQGAAGDSPVVGADNGEGGDQGGGQPAGSAAAPTPPGLKPFAGTYRFHTTGHATVNGSPQNIDTQDASVTEDLNDTDQRITTSSGQGQQIQVLRYSGDKVELVSLELKGAVSKTFNGPVQLFPVPASVGQTWNWSMRSTDTDPTRQTTLTQSSRVDRTESVVIGGQSVDVFVIETDLTFSSAATDLNGTGHLTNWVSPVYKVAPRSHSTLNGKYAAFTFDSDTTTELLDLRPS